MKKKITLKQVAKIGKVKWNYEPNSENLWDLICSHIGFDKKGKELQGAIRKFIELKLKEQKKEFISGERCMKCGNKKEYNPLSDWCGKCLEE